MQRARATWRPDFFVRKKTDCVVRVRLNTNFNIAVNVSHMCKGRTRSGDLEETLV